MRGNKIGIGAVALVLLSACGSSSAKTTLCTTEKPTNGIETKISLTSDDEIIEKLELESIQKMEDKELTDAAVLERQKRFDIVRDEVEGLDIKASVKGGKGVTNTIFDFEKVGPDDTFTNQAVPFLKLKKGKVNYKATVKAIEEKGYTCE